MTKLALVHDIGKLFVPLEVLDKPGKLTPEEFSIIKRHSDLGANFLKEKSGLPEKFIIGTRSHHEFLDGSGYPQGLSGSQIPDFVRILTISDIYSALIEKRSYKEAYSPRAALTIMWDMKGKLDEALLPVFNREFSSSGFGRAPRRVNR